MNDKVQEQAKAPRQKTQAIELADSALDAAVGAGDDTVKLQYGAIEVGSAPRKSGDPDQPIITGRLY